MKSFSIGEYRESFGSNVTRDKNWEPGIGEPETPPAPARSIAVTPEMQARDAADRAAREERPQTAWSAFRDTLSEDNLRKVKRPVAAGRQEQRPAIRSPQPRVQRVVKTKPAPKVIAPPTPVPKEIQPTMPKALFTIGESVPLATVPRSYARSDRGTYVPLFESLKKLMHQDVAVPVTVPNRKAGDAVTVGLKKLAGEEHLRLNRSRNADFTIYYFNLERAEPAAK